MQAQGVDSLDAHAVEPHALFESLGVVFAARVEHAHGFGQLAQGDAAAIVAHGDVARRGEGDLDAFARSHLELVDAVVDGFFQEHVNAVFRV